MTPYRIAMYRIRKEMNYIIQTILLVYFGTTLYSAWNFLSGVGVRDVSY